MSCPFKHIAAATPLASSLTSDAINTNSANHGGNNSVNKLVTYIQASADAAFLLDREGKIVYRNRAARLMFLTNDMNNMSISSIFQFTQPPSDLSTWDDLATNLTSEPQHHDVTVLEEGGIKLAFTLNLVKLPNELMGDDNQDVFACAYVIPAHDDQNGSPKNDNMHSIAEEGSMDDNQQLLHNHMRDVVQANLDPMLCIQEDGKIAIANDAAVHVFGYSHDEFNGKSLASICPTAREVQNILSYMHVPSIKKQQITTATTKAGMKLSIELGLSLNQTFSGSSEPICFAHMKDLTTLEEHKAELEHKDNLCQAMINASFDPMFGIDQRGKIVVANEAASQAFGYTNEEFIGNNIKMICNDKDAINHDKHLQRYITTGEKHVIGRKRPLMARRKDGTEFHIELGVSEVLLKDGEKMFCGYVRDRTQERLDKQMLRRKDAVIQDKFFNRMTEPGDARGALRKEVPRCTQ